jgi:hypothetical protein
MEGIETQAKKQYTQQLADPKGHFDLHVRNTQGSRLLNANQTAQGIVHISQILSDPELNKPGHGTEKWIKLGVSGAHTAMGASGVVVDTLTMYKPTSTLGVKFGGG